MKKRWERFLFLGIIVICFAVSACGKKEQSVDELSMQSSTENLVPENAVQKDTEIKGSVTVTQIPSKEDVLAMRKIVLEGMSDEEIERLTENIKVANLTMENSYLYENLFEKLADKESLYWNYFDKKGDIQIDWAVESDINMKKTMESEGISEEEFYQKYGQPVVTYNRFDAANFIALVEDMQKSVQNELLRADLQQLINAASLAAETHDMEYANDIYKILHDMDYFLLRYGIEDVGGYTRYDDVVSKYYGVLNVYGEDSLISE